MKWTLLLVLVSIGLVAGDGAWKENRVYKYNLRGYARNNKGGVVTRARLSIYPQSNDLLIGQISEAEYSKVDQQLSGDEFDLNDRDVTYIEWPLNSQFKIHLGNGAINSLSVDRELTNDQINQIKAIVSQFQVDTKAQNFIQSGDNHLPERNSNNAFYKTMEPTVTGKCETIYDISAIPEYLIQAHQKWVPLPNLKKDGEFIKIVKTRNFNNCNERNGFIYSNSQSYFKSNRNEMNFERRYGQNDFISTENNRNFQRLNGFSSRDSMNFERRNVRNDFISGGNDMNFELKNNQNDFTSVGNDMNFERRNVQNDFKTSSNEMNVDRRVQMDKTTSSPLVTRTIISGDLRTYTIQSSVSTGNAGGFYEYLEITLESVEESNNRRQFRLGNLNNAGNMVNVGNLVYTSNVENSGHSMTDSQNNGLSMTDSQNNGPSMTDSQTYLRGEAKCPKAENAPEQWSSCWTAFPSADTICKNEFTPEWEDIGTSCCGFLCLGKQAKCRRSYPGCKSTVCYSVFVPIDTLCNDQFKDSYPVRCRGFVDCSPGFYGARCCPKSYE